MKRYWVVAPYNSTKPEIFERAWDYDLKHETIAVGWRELGDVSGIDSRSELELKYRQVYGEGVSQSVVTKDVNALWRFYHEISPGDVVIARRGTKRIIGVGTVTGDPFYDVQRGTERVGSLTDDAYSNFLPVKWDEKIIEFDRIVFSFYTIYEISEERIPALIEGDDEEREEYSTEFVLEKYLEDFIVTNFDRFSRIGCCYFEIPRGT